MAVCVFVWCTISWAMTIQSIEMSSSYVKHSKASARQSIQSTVCYVWLTVRMFASMCCFWAHCDDDQSNINDISQTVERRAKNENENENRNRTNERREEKRKGRGDSEVLCFKHIFDCLMLLPFGWQWEKERGQCVHAFKLFQIFISHHFSATLDKIDHQVKRFFTVRLHTPTSISASQPAGGAQ